MLRGNDSATAQQVFDNLYAHYLAAIPVERTEILWSGPIYIALYAVVLVVFFWLFAFWLKRTGGSSPRLFELTSFDAILTERIGKIAVFSYVVWAAVVIWAGYFGIKQAVFGLIY
ncbi:hypothetical protein HKCCE3408_11195 [Rhodobacterales bacterium HKCCE3408]|nr:hypothetical protein [Rhodobacterales bacterium HKCCE3408]